MLGDCAISSAVITVVDAPVIPAPPNRMPLTVSASCTVPGAGSVVEGRPMPPTPVNRLLVTLMSGSVTLCAIAAPHVADDRSAASAAAPVRPVLEKAPIARSFAAPAQPEPWVNTPDAKDTQTPQYHRR